MRTVAGKDKKNLKILFLVAVMIITGVAMRPLMYLAALVILMYILFNPKKEDTFALLFFMMPIATVFKLAAGSTSLFTYVQLVFELLLFVKHHKRINRSFFIAFLFYVCYVLFGMGTAFTDGIKQIFLPVLLYFCLLPEYSVYKQKYAESYTVGVILSSITGWFMDYIPNMSEFVNVKTERVSSSLSYTRFAGLWGDPNYYAVNVVLAFSLIMYFHIKGQIPTLKASLYYVILILFGAITGSKSFLFMIVIVLLWFIIELFKHGRYFLSGLITIAGVFAGVLILNGTISVFDTAIARLLSNNSNLSELTTNRSDLWIMYIREFVDRPFKLLIGNGLSTAYTFTAPHNTYIDYIDIYGVIGTLFFLATIYFIERNYAKSRVALNYIPISVLLIMWFALSMIRYLDFAWQMTLAFLIICDVKDVSEATYVEENFDKGVLL